MSKAWRSLAGTSARRSAGCGSLASPAGGGLLPAAGQVGQEAADRVQRLLLGAGQVMPAAGHGAVHPGAPISSRVVRSRTTISTIRGLPRYIEALPSTMVTKSQNAGM